MRAEGDKFGGGEGVIIGEGRGVGSGGRELRLEESRVVVGGSVGSEGVGT